MEIRVARLVAALLVLGELLHLYDDVPEPFKRVMTCGQQRLEQLDGSLFLNNFKKRALIIPRIPQRRCEGSPSGAPLHTGGASTLLGR